MLQEQIDNTGKTYSGRSYIQSLVNQLYEYAIANDITVKNYAKGLDLGENEQSELYIPFTEKEIQNLFKYIHVSFIDIVLITIYTGMRTADQISPIEFHLDQRYIVGGSKTAARKNSLIPLHQNIIDLVKNRFNKYGGIFEKETNRGAFRDLFF